jgi:hypothetical protein
MTVRTKFTCTFTFSDAVFPRVTAWSWLLLLTAVWVAGCGSNGSTPVSPTPTQSSPLHDTLVPADSSIMTGTFAVGTESAYSAPFDDFIPKTNGAIRSVEWQGYYCNTAFTGNAIPDPVATSFIIRLAPSEAGMQRPPFDALRATATTGASQVTTVAAAAVRQQLEFTRMDAACGARNGGDPAAYYRFSADLSSPYAVTAGSQYWIAIYAVMPAVQESWHWRFGMQDNSYSIFWLNGSLSSGTLTMFFADRAFAVRQISI